MQLTDIQRDMIRRAAHTGLLHRANTTASPHGVAILDHAGEPGIVNVYDHQQAGQSLIEFDDLIARGYLSDVRGDGETFQLSAAGVRLATDLGFIASN